MIEQYRYYEECPLTDEDLAIVRGLASRIGGAYWSVFQSLSGIAHLRDAMLAYQLVRGKQRGNWRYDCNGRLHSVAWSHADTVSEYC